MANLVITLAILYLFISSSRATALQKRRLGVAKPPILDEISGLKKIAPPQFGLPVFNGIQAAMIAALLPAGKGCDRYIEIDRLVTESKNRKLAPGIPLAKKLATLEKAFNQFDNAGGAKPSFCDDPAQPVSPEVRCIVPLIDPAFPGAAAYNAAATARNEKISAVLEGSPDQCAGQSVLQQALALGLTDCIECKNSPGANNSTQTPPASTDPPKKGDPTQPKAESSKPTDPPKPKKCKPKKS